MRIVLFSVGGADFGIPADQVLEVTAYDHAESADLFWFHDEIGFNPAEDYSSPVIIAVRTGAAEPYRIIIDSLLDITECRRQDIRHFPELVEHFVLKKGLWGVLPRNGRLIFLVDCNRLYDGSCSRLIN